MFNCNTIIFRLFLAIFVLLGTTFSFAQHQQNLRNHVETLSSPIFAGRETGSWGQKLAAIYIQEQFQNARIDTFSFRHVQDGGFLCFDQDTLFHKQHFFYSGFDEKVVSVLNQNDFEIIQINASGYYHERFKKSEKIKLYLIEDWDNFLDVFGHKFSSERYIVIPENKQREIFVNRASLNNEVFVTVSLDLVEHVELYKSENLVVPIYFNENNTETIVICAHYDHLGEELGQYYPGADDNASGVAVLVELAKLLDIYCQDGAVVLGKNIQVVFFSGEEQGMLGSFHHVFVSPYFANNTRLCINMDMVGFVHSESTQIYAVDYTFNDEYADYFNQLTSTTIDIKQVRYQEFLNDFNSDHQSFLSMDISSILFFTGLHPFYHTPMDTPEKLNYDAMSALVNSIFLSVIKYAN